jgi:DNA-binding IclR family transcriptional regulator
MPSVLGMTTRDDEPMLSIGHQTSLFDVLAGLPPATSIQIADAAGLDEQHVREWLCGLAALQIVDYDPAKRTYSLPVSNSAGRQED